MTRVLTSDQARKLIGASLPARAIALEVLSWGTIRGSLVKLRSLHPFGNAGDKALLRALSELEDLVSMEEGEGGLTLSWRPKNVKDSHRLDSHKKRLDIKTRTNKIESPKPSSNQSEEFSQIKIPRRSFWDSSPNQSVSLANQANFGVSKGGGLKQTSRSDIFPSPRGNFSDRDERSESNQGSSNWSQPSNRPTSSQTEGPSNPFQESARPSKPFQEVATNPESESVATATSYRQIVLPNCASGVSSPPPLPPSSPRKKTDQQKLYDKAQKLVRLWVDRTGRPETDLRVLPVHIKLVRDRFREGYSFDELAMAVAGIAYSPWHREHSRDLFELAVGEGRVDKAKAYWWELAPVELIRAYEERTGHRPPSREAELEAIEAEERVEEAEARQHEIIHKKVAQLRETEREKEQAQAEEAQAWSGLFESEAKAVEEVTEC